MSEIEQGVRPSLLIREGHSGDLPGLEFSWNELYAQQVREGLRVSIPQDGYRLWSDSLTAVLGRFACLFVAELDGLRVGFAAGRLRSLPLHFGAEPVGYISEIFVRADQRSRGIGAALLKATGDWFHKEGVSRLELNVVAKNTRALKFYGKMGWTAELIQMVSIIGDAE